MRFLRDFATAAGASGSIIAAGGIMLAILSAGLAFHGWPGMRSPSDLPGAVPRELAQGGASPHGAPGADRVASISTLPAVPVVAPRATPRSVARRHPRARRQGSSGHANVPQQTAPTVSAPDDASSPAAATPPASSSPPPSSGGGSSPSSPAPALPSVPSVPAPSAPSPSALPDAAAQVLQGATQAAGGAVSDIAGGAGGAVQPASPPTADSITNLGQAVAQTVTAVGETVGGLLGGRR
jgi:hypothetical protein